MCARGREIGLRNDGKCSKKECYRLLLKLIRVLLSAFATRRKDLKRRVTPNENSFEKICNPISECVMNLIRVIFLPTYVGLILVL